MGKAKKARHPHDDVWDTLVGLSNLTASLYVPKEQVLPVLARRGISEAKFEKLRTKAIGGGGRRANKQLAVVYQEVLGNTSFENDE